MKASEIIDRLRWNLQSLEAAERGERLISDSGEIWFNPDPALIAERICKGSWFRPFPEPKRRPWMKPEDVPGPACWLRLRDRDCENASLEVMIIAVSHRGVTRFTDENHFLEWGNTNWEKLEYSTDRKTWHKCEVIDDGAAAVPSTINHQPSTPRPRP